MNLKRKFRKLVFIIGVGFLAFSISLPMAYSATKPFPFEDANNNGVYDSGDRDITDEIKSGIFVTEHSIVIPGGVGGFITSSENGFLLVAGQNITLNNYYLASNSRNAGISLYAEAGTITIGAALKSNGFVSIHAEGDITIGASVYANGDLADIYSAKGNITVQGKAALYGREGLYLEAVAVTAASGSWLKSAMRCIAISGTDDIVIEGNRVDAICADIATQGHLITFRNNLVTVPKADGWVYLGAEGSTVDIRGSKFRNLVLGETLIIEGDLIQ
jgi:hypothetical protein